MEIRQLRYFIEICKCKSFAQAADACFISAQGINMSIGRLENELGQQLFRRSRKGVELTLQGEFLLPRAKKVIALIDECDAYFAKGAACEHLLPVAFALGTIEEFAGSVLSEFSSLHPEIQVETKECFDTVCDAMVLNQEVELGLTVGPVHDEGLDAELLFSSRHALIVPLGHPLASRKLIMAQDLRDIPVCILKPETRTFPAYRSVCLQAGFEPKIHMFADNILLVFYMAESQQIPGISTIPLANRLGRPSLCAVPFADPMMDWNIYLIKRKGTVLSPAARLFQQALLAKRDLQKAILQE